MKSATPQQWECFFSSHTQGFRKLNGKQAKALCPFHSDVDPSVSIDLKEGLWNCKGCGEKGNGITFAKKQGISLESLPGWEKSKGNEIARYIYRDENGNPLYHVIRTDTKEFWQELPDGTRKLNGVRRVPYRLPELLVAPKDIAFVVEGEKDVDTLRGEGLISTCNPMGAGCWRDEYAEPLKSFSEIVIVADKDEPGRKHAYQVAASVLKVIEKVKVLELPGDGVKDATDFFNAGGNPETLMDLVRSAPLWEPRTAQNDCTTPIEINSGAIIFSPLPAPTFVANKPPDRVWIWDMFIPQGGLVLLGGAPKAGKSTLAYHLAKAVAEGQPFLGFSTKQTKVLILSLEEHPSDVSKRMEDLDMVMPEVLVQPGPLRAKPEVIEAMARFIHDQGVGLVIVDTISTFWMVEDENSAAQTGLALDPILQLARASGAAIFLLHHLRKTPGNEGEDIRGSSDVFAKMDVALTFRRRGDQKTERRLRAFSRYQTPDELVISLEDGVYKALGSDYQVRKSTEREKVMAVLTLEYQRVESLAPLTGLSETTCRRVLNALFGEGQIVRQGTGSRGKAYSYALKSENNCTNSQLLGGAINSDPKDANLPSILGSVQAVFPGAKVRESAQP